MLNAYSRRKDGNALLSRSFRVREFACRDGTKTVTSADKADQELEENMKIGVWPRERT